MSISGPLRSFYDKINIKIKAHHRIIILILCLGYIALIIYLEEEEKQEDYSQYLEIFKHDKLFFEQLYNMEPKMRDQYLKSIKKILDDKDVKNNKKVKIINKIKNTAVFAGLTELLLGGGGLGSFVTSTARNAFTIGMTGAFT